MGIVINSPHNTKTRSHFLLLLLLLLSASASFAQQYFVHTVGKGETAYAIAKTYSISLDSLYVLNPDAKGGLHDGQELRIYSIVQHPEAPADSIAGNILFHKVQAKETLYALSKQYNIGIQTILQENPEVIDGLNAGQLIRLPHPVQAAAVVPNKSTPTPNAPLDKKKESTPISKDESPSFALVSPLQKTSKVALFLPLNLNQQMPWDDTTLVKQSEQPSLATPALEFYEGFWLAADSLKKMGYRIDLSVQDTRNDTAYIKEILTNPRLAENDLLIGPLSSNEMMPVQRFAQEHHLDLAVPCSVSPVLLAANPKLSSTAASVRSQCESMASYLSQHFAQDQFIFVSTGSQKEMDLINNFKTKLPASRIRAQLTYPKMGVDTLRKCVSKKSRTVIIVCSSNESVVNNFLTSIKGMQDSSLFVVGMPTWENFQSLEFGLLQKLQVQLFSTMQVDFSDARTQQFAVAYRAQFNTEPSASACQGFDMGLFYLGMLGSKGKSWMNELGGQTYEAMQGRFVFRRVEGGGCENTAISVMRYENKQLTIIRY